MARIRSTHPGQWTDEDFVECSPLARLLCIGLRNEADDKGIFEWKPKGMKMRLLPADNADIEGLLAELVSNSQIKGFEHGGKKYGAIRNFRKWQRPKTPNNVHPIPDDFLEYVGMKAKKPGKDSEKGAEKDNGISEIEGDNNNPISETGGKTHEQREEEGDKREEEGDITTTTLVSENGGVGDFEETPFSADPLPENAEKTVEELNYIPPELRRDDEPEPEPAPELHKRLSLADQCEPDTREPKTPQDAIAAAYMEMVNKVYENKHLLTHPGHGAPMIAKRWIEAGADLELCKSVFETVLMDQKTKGEQPPKTLKYFDNPIARAIKEASAPMPEASAGNQWGKKEPVGLHADAEKTQWEGRIKGFRDKGFWMDSWGPNPDQPGCEAPAELLGAAE